MLFKKSKTSIVDRLNQTVETWEPSAEDHPQIAPTKSQRFWQSVKKRKVLIIIAAVLLIGIVAFSALGNARRQNAQSADYENYTVAKHDITVKLTGTGTLEAADSYTVTTLLSGEITAASFEEGDSIAKDSVLYQIDSSQAATGIEQAELNLAKSQRNYDQAAKTMSDLQVKAINAGAVVDIAVQKGDNVQNGQVVATVRNSKTMSLKLPFSSDDASQIKVGQTATVTIEGSFEELSGKVTEISGVDERLEGNMVVRQVTIEVNNPGAIGAGQAATALVGKVASSNSGTFSYKTEDQITAKAAGEVIALNAKAGQSVSQGQVLLTLSSDSVQNGVADSKSAVRQAELDLANQVDKLDDYSIKSPIAGQIVEKNQKAGDTIESGQPLCTIFDLSYLTLTLNIDELDIAKVSVGQEVAITAEAVPGQSFSGRVTKININGSTNSGVTTYPVTIQIDQPGNLLPGMNVQAEIVISDNPGVLAIPVEAVSRGNLVLVKTTAQGAEAGPPQLPEGGLPQNVDGSMPERPEGAPSGEDGPQFGQGGGNAQMMHTQADLPAGFAYAQVELGVSDGSYIEVKSGLKAGDIIAYTAAVVPEQQNMMFGGPGMGGGGQGEVRVERVEAGPATNSSGGGMP